jgi:methanogenic corrinoid protein MtbC1
MAMVELDERLFNDIVSSLTLKIGFEETVLNILYPFLEKIGILWITGNIHPAQEHFITNLIRQKLIVVIDALPVPEKASRNFLLFLRDGEFHELSMLFMNYILRVNGFYTYYLGQTVPLEDVIKVCEKHKPEFIATSFITSSLQEKPKDFLLKLSEAVPDTMIIAGGRQLCEDDQKSLPANCTFAKDSTDFKQIIGKL